MRGAPGRPTSARRRRGGPAESALDRRADVGHRVRRDWSRLQAWARAVIEPPARLSALDAVFLPMETGNQPLHVGSLLVFEGPAPGIAAVREHLEGRAAALPAARRRIVRAPLDLGRPRWSDAGVIHLDDHLAAAVVAAPGDHRALCALVLRLMRPRLDLSGPPWRMWVIEGLADGSWAVLVTAHHTMVDGVYGSDLALSMLSDVPLPAPDGTQVGPPPPTPARFVAEGLGWLVLLPLRTGAFVVRAAAHPGVAATRVRRLRHGVAQVVHPDLPPSPLSGPLSEERLWDWVEGDLADMQAAACRGQVSVNEVFLAVLTGGYRHYLARRGCDLGAVVLRAIVPVTRRRGGPPLRPGNLASAMFVELPVDITDASERVSEVSRRSTAQKAEHVGSSTAAVVALADHVPWPLLAWAFRAYARAGQRRVNVIATNVAGPVEPHTLLGRRLSGFVPYVPLGQQIRAGAGLVSCGGRVAMALTCDPTGLPDADALMAAMADSWHELVVPGTR